MLEKSSLRKSKRENLHGPQEPFRIFLEPSLTASSLRRPTTSGHLREASGKLAGLRRALAMRQKKKLLSRIASTLRKGSIHFSPGWPPVSYSFPLGKKQRSRSKKDNAKV